MQRKAGENVKADRESDVTIAEVKVQIIKKMVREKNMAVGQCKAWLLLPKFAIFFTTP